MDSKYSRTGIRRSGDDYQDIVALEVFADFLEHHCRYQWIRVEADDKGYLDDIVCIRADGSFEVKQVKFSGYPGEDDDPWTWRKLLEKKDGKQSLIEKWASSIEKIKKQGTIYKASLESNRRSDEIQKTLNVYKHVDFERINDKETKDELVRQIGDENSTRYFFSVFCFNIDRPGLDELEEAIERRFLNIGITEEGWKNIKDELRKWVRKKEEPKPDGRITLEKIRIAARWHQLEQLYQKFPIPIDFVLPSEDFHKALLVELDTIKNGCIVIAANPGMGKSTYLSSLYNHLDSKEAPVIRHHYFISMEDRTFGRYDHKIIAESLMSEIKSKYPLFLGQLLGKNASYIDLHQWLEVCGKEFRNKGKSLVVIIDGIDQIWREKQSIDELVNLFEHLLPTPEGVIIIVGTQPIDDMKIPRKLLQETPREKWKLLPPLDIKGVRKWVSNYENRANLPTEKDRRDNILDQLAAAFYKKSLGNPLYLHYSMKEIGDKGLDLNVSTIEKLTDCPHNDIMKYYDGLLSTLPEEGKQILHLFSMCPFPWKPDGIVQCLEKQANSSQIIDSLNKVKHLMKEDACGLSLFHNSLAVFLSEQPNHTTYSNIIKPLALQWLTEKAPDYLRWNYEWLIRAEIGDEQPLIYGPNREWVVDAISNPYPRDNISKILAQSGKAALRRENLERVIEIWFLRDYYNAAFYDRSEILDYLFYSQLFINNDPYFHDNNTSNILSKTSMQLLLLSEKNLNNESIVEICFNELYERQRGNRLEPRRTREDWISLINCFLKVAAMYEKISLENIIKGAIEAKSRNTYSNALEIFCGALKTYRKVAAFRNLLKLNVSQEANHTILRYAIFLSFEEGFDLSREVLSSSGDSFAAVYAFIRNLNGFSISCIEFPADWDKLVVLTGGEIYNKKEEITKMIYDIFFNFLAYHLWGRSNKNDEWINKISSYSWPRSLVEKMNQASQEVAKILRAKSEIPFNLLFDSLDDLRRPTWAGDEFNVYYAESAETAINQIALDLLLINNALGKKPEIHKNELIKAFKSHYFDPWTWFDMFISCRRAWLNQETLDWLGSELDTKIKSSICSFPERALNYSRLAALYSLHNMKENAKMYVSEASKNIVSYGYHKDILLFGVLDILRACYDANVSEARKWIRELIPAIVFVRDFTDGDETRHLLEELGDFLSIYEPKLLVSYHNWLQEWAKFDYARSVLNSFLRNANLSNSVSRAIAKTAVDPESLLILSERSELGDEGAKNVLLSITKLLGENAIQKAKDKIKKEEGYSSVSSVEKSIPNPEKFPPESFKEYVKTANSVGSLSDYIDKWIAYWRNTERREQAYESIKKAVEQGLRLYEYDSFFDFTFSLLGREQAYPWLVKTQIESYGWSPYWTSREKSVQRWKIIKEHYSERWFDFIKDSLEPIFSEPWRYMTINMFVRLIEFCFYMGKPELAKNVSRQVVASTLELVSPLNLPILKWVDENG